MSIGSVNVPGSIGVGIKSNLNLFHNAYWANKEAIINQRGKLLYDSHGYSIDRWILWDADTTLEITDNGLHIYRNSHTGGATFTQKFERNFLAPGVYTFSVLSTNGVERLNYYIQGIGDIFSDFDTNKELATHTFIVPETVKDKDHWVSFFGKYGSIVRAAKLEPGPVSTLAHKDAAGNWVLNDPPPDYGLELLKCQRYQVHLSDYSVSFGKDIGNRTVVSTSIPLPNMRTSPTVSIEKMNIPGVDIIDFNANDFYISTSRTGVFFTWKTQENAIEYSDRSIIFANIFADANL